MDDELRKLTFIKDRKKKKRMASKYSQKFDVPEGFADLLRDFTREVLREQPKGEKSILEFGEQYFKQLSKKRDEIDFASNMEAPAPEEAVNPSEAS